MKGVFTNFGLSVDEQTQQQFDECCSYDFVVSASLMPDAHSGYVAPIGSVIITDNVVVPSWVGYDIGCGMTALKINSDKILDIKKNLHEIYDKVKTVVPMGIGKIGKHGDVSEQNKSKFKKIYSNYEKNKHDKIIAKFLKTQALSHLGSLGSGNHFIELGENDKKELWIIIHSGSRGVGKTTATHYMKQAAGSEKQIEKTASFKLDSQEGEEYMNVLNFALEFALLNRLEMAYRIEKVLREIVGDDLLTLDLWTNKNHNHAIIENDLVIHRKGATPAKKNERGVIPGNMRDGSFLVLGKGNKEFLESSSHGAGRVLSRRKAKQTLLKNDFEKDMKDIVSSTEDEFLDEAPQAYKNIFDVMNFQKDSVEVVDHIRPLINWKG